MNDLDEVAVTYPGFNPKGSVCVITGGSSGIGKALVNELKKREAKIIIIADINLINDNTQKNIKSYKVDVGNNIEMKRFIDNVYDEFGTIDLFCANAGVATDDDATASNEHWEKVWKVNVAQHTHAARECIPRMINKGSGWFLITASAAGLLSQVGSATYSTTKHAAVGFAEWLAITYGDQGIGVSLLCPQGVRTAMTAKMDNGGIAGIDGMLEPEDVAKFTINGMIKGKFLITPHMIVREYQKKKASNPERWIKGMRKLYKKFGNLFDN